MVSCPRRKLLGKDRKGVYHCWARCVRRAYLLNEGHQDRRRWIIEREEQLAGLFAIEIEFRAEMRNHLHLILRSPMRTGWTSCSRTRSTSSGSGSG